MKTIWAIDRQCETHTMVVNGGTKREDAICAAVTNYLITLNGWGWIFGELREVRCEGDMIEIHLKSGDVMKWEIVE